MLNGFAYTRKSTQTDRVSEKPGHERSVKSPDCTNRKRRNEPNRIIVLLVTVFPDVGACSLANKYVLFEEHVLCSVHGNEVSFSDTFVIIKYTASLTGKQKSGDSLS